MFRQVSITTLIRPLLLLAILFVGMVLYLSERQNAIDKQVDAILNSVQARDQNKHFQLKNFFIFISLLT
jgi:preprotein translocase subunit YajC